MSRLQRAALIALPALGLAYAALVSGLDRLGVDRVTPAPGAAAERDRAMRAVLADPMDAGASSALGLARLKLHDGIGAEAAFRVAGQLGWRDKPTQLYWMALSADSGALPLAAQRADALLRQDARLREQPRLLATLEASPAGRRALAARLALRPAWFGDYWGKLYLLDPGQLANRSRLLDEPALRPPVMACADVRTMASVLSEKGIRARSRAILDRFCRTRGGAMLADGGFESAQLDATAPNGWQFVGEGGLDVRLEGGGSGGKAVVVASALALRQVFASQALQLAPGRYRVSWRMVGATAGISARLTCQQATGDFLATAPSGSDRLAATAEVGADCPTQWLELAVDPGAGPIAVDDVKIERAG